jgi:hypothetical protein
VGVHRVAAAALEGLAAVAAQEGRVAAAGQGDRLSCEQNYDNDI